MIENESIFELKFREALKTWFFVAECFIGKGAQPKERGGFSGESISSERKVSPKSIGPNLTKNCSSTSIFCYFQKTSRFQDGKS